MTALLFDTETTGLIHNASMSLDKLPEIIEFYGAVVDLDTGTVGRELHCMIKPEHPLAEERKPEFTSDGKVKKGRKTITEITGITKGMLKNCRPFRAYSKDIFSIIEDAPLIILQNASFDVEMVNIEAARLGTVVAWPPVICTIEQSVHYKGYRLNLADLHRHLTGEDFSGAHRAKADVAALIRIAVEMHKRGDL